MILSGKLKPCVLTFEPSEAQIKHCAAWLSITTVTEKLLLQGQRFLVAVDNASILGSAWHRKGGQHREASAFIFNSSKPALFIWDHVITLVNSSGTQKRLTKISSECTLSRLRSVLFNGSEKRLGWVSFHLRLSPPASFLRSYVSVGRTCLWHESSWQRVLWKR